MQVETPDNSYVKLHSHTTKEQGLFLQEIFDKVKPSKSVEVGLAYGISTLFILEKHRDMGHSTVCHIAIEPYPWGGVAEYNIEKEGLENLIEIRYEKSDQVLPRLFYENHRVQFAYVDTTKVFDIVMQDFYFIDKILDVNGIIVLDDCGGGWPGVQRWQDLLILYPTMKCYAKHSKIVYSRKKRLLEKAVTKLIAHDSI